MIMKTLHKIFLVFAMLMFATTINAQQFICTDISFGEACPATRIQRIKKETLGATMKLTFYNRSVRMEVDGESVILDKVNDSKYQAKMKRDFGVLDLEKTFGYINSAKLTAYRDGKHYFTIKMKRK